MQSPARNQNQRTEQTAKSSPPQGCPRIFVTTLSSPHPSPTGQPGSTEADGCSPGRRRNLSPHLPGLQSTPGWGSASQQARLAVTARLAGDHPSPAVCLQARLAVPLLNASPQPPGKRDPDTQGSRSQGLVFLAPGPGRWAGPDRTAGPYLCLLLHGFYHTHFGNNGGCRRVSPLLLPTPKWMFAIGKFHWEQMQDWTHF